MKKIIVDSNKCIGCGACVGIDAKHFDFDDQGMSHVISQDNLESNELNEAIAGCPVSAISLVNADKCQCENDDCECGDDCSCQNCNCNKKTA